MPDGILVVDKPEGFTSHDVVNIVRKTYQMKKVGHTGTLDPDATGVLVVCLGEATKLVPYLTADEKVYEATFVLGKRTTTLDASGEEVESRSLVVEEDDVKAALKDFTGKISQIPPMHSAIKVDGKKLYEYARKGQTIERKPRDVEVFRLDLTSFSFPEGTLYVRCSSGTYIRSLIDDIGEQLGTLAYMKTLRRTSVGLFNINQAVSVESLKEGKRAQLLPLREGVLQLPLLSLEKRDQEALLQGKKLDYIEAEGDLWRLENNGQLKGIVERVEHNGASYIKLKRGIQGHGEKSWM